MPGPALCSALRGFKPPPKCTYHQHRKISIFLLQNSLLLLEITRCSKGQGQKEVSSIPRGREEKLGLSWKTRETFLLVFVQPHPEGQREILPQNSIAIRSFSRI